MKKALFLDRDGVIWQDTGHLYKKEDVKFTPGIFKLCSICQEWGYLIIIVTNQAGVAKGYYTEQDYHNITTWMYGEFLKNGIDITKVYYCIDHPDYSGFSINRKPESGMFIQAKNEFNIDMRSSINIGDKESDVVAGAGAGIIKNFFFLTDKYKPEMKLNYTIINDLLEVVKYL